MAVQESPRTHTAKKFLFSRAVLRMKIAHSRVRTYCAKRHNNWVSGWVSAFLFWGMMLELDRFIG